MCLLNTLLKHYDTNTPLNCKIFNMWKLKTPRHTLGAGLLYREGIDRASVLVEAVQI